jgi:DNA-directed RNA polymerase III subunit RPC8
MFVLVEIKDTVRIPPWLFNVRFNDAVVEALNKKFANKVIFVRSCFT